MERKEGSIEYREYLKRMQGAKGEANREKDGKGKREEVQQRKKSRRRSDRYEKSLRGESEKTTEKEV